MGNDHSPFPLEFYLTGSPISLQGSSVSKARWKKKVELAARLRIQQTVELCFLEDEPLAITIYHFPDRSRVCDLDNLIKPILDALVGVAYLDDRAIERVTAQRFDLEENWNFSTPSTQLSNVVDLVKALKKSSSLVYVRLSNDLSWRRL